MILLWIVTACALALCAGVFLRINTPSLETRIIRAGLTGITRAEIYTYSMYPPPPSPLILHDGAAQEVASALVLKKASKCGDSCGCDPTHGLKFYKDGRVVASFGLRHGTKLYSDDKLWQGDLALSKHSQQYLWALLERQISSEEIDSNN
ncbi:MAG: hypothetical protein PHT33_09035 [bacterium]|nr:hypothetical protein [bacterium]